MAYGVSRPSRWPEFASRLPKPRDDGRLLRVTDDPCQLRIERLAAGGDGVARAENGRVVFVPETAPGDRVRVRIVEERKRFARAQVITRIADGDDRVEPKCPVYGACGGCAWQHVAYPAQLAAKQALLRDALERLGDLRLDAPPDVVPCPRPYGYRSRTRVVAKAGRVGYRRRRSHDLCETSACPVLAPALERRLAALAAARPEGEEEWELVAGADGSTRALPLAHPLADDPRIAIDVLGDRLEFSPGVFVQGNALLHDALARSVHEAAGSGERCVELFAGGGFFSVGLARRFARLVVVESEGRAVSDLRRNLLRSGCRNVEVRGARAERVLAALPRPVDVVVVDPPRTGLPPGCTEALAELAPERLVYVSCDPATLARDLGQLSHAGYTLANVRGFDLFPQTPHLEAVATLTKETARPQTSKP